MFVTLFCRLLQLEVMHNNMLIINILLLTLDHQMTVKLHVTNRQIVITQLRRSRELRDCFIIIRLMSDKPTVHYLSSTKHQLTTINIVNN